MCGCGCGCGCVCGCVCVCVCVCACVCVGVWGVKDQRESGINVRKEKVKTVRGVCQCQ